MKFQIKKNQQARTLIHNATEEIKSLLHFDESQELSFQNDTTKMLVTRKMNTMSSQVEESHTQQPPVTVQRQPPVTVQRPPHMHLTTALSNRFYLKRSGLGFFILYQFTDSLLIHWNSLVC